MFGYIYESSWFSDTAKNYVYYVGQHKSKIFEPDKYKGSGLLIKKHIEKYGFDSVSCKLLCECDSKDLLDEKEKQYIKEYRDKYDNLCVNLTDGGDGSCGYTFTEEQRKKMGDSHRGSHRTQETKERMSKAQSGKNNLMYGRPVSEETREKLRQSHIGKNTWCSGRKLSEEHKKHISESLFENPPFLGKSHSEESNLKNKLSHKNRIPIICVETGEIFLSITDSVRSMGTTKCQIKKCLDDPERTCVGYHWRKYE